VRQRQRRVEEIARRRGAAEGGLKSNQTLNLIQSKFNSMR
jgi:hypothetical protein